MHVRDLDRCTRKDLLLNGDFKIPVRRPYAPAIENRRIKIIDERVRAELLIGYRPAEIATRGAEVLRNGIQQVAVRNKVAIGVNPAARDAGRTHRGGRLRHAQCRIAVRVVAERPGAFEVLAELELERRLAASKDVD